MNDEKLIKEYVKIVLQEGAYFRRYNDKNKKSGGGFLNTIKNFFTGHGTADKIAKKWINEKENDYGFKVPSDTQEEVLKYIEARVKNTSKEMKGNEEKFITRGLDRFFLPQLRALEKSHYKL